jgi:hypothetical protein
VYRYNTMGDNTDDDYNDDDDYDIECFEDSLIVGSRYMGYAIFHVGRWIYETWNNNLQYLLVKGVWLCSSVLVQLDNASIYCYDNSNILRNSVDYANYMNQSINKYLSNCYSEPTDSNWIQVCSLHKKDDDLEEYFETYRILDDNISFNDAVDSFDHTFQGIYRKGTSIIMKYNAKYTILARLSHRTLVDTSESELSKFKPLSITYQQLDSDNIIDIYLNDNMWCAGNELFTVPFVRRCLEYHGDDFEFSNNYRITIIDADVNIITLTRNEYIEVNENSIIVKSMDSITDDEESEEDSFTDGEESSESVESEESEESEESDVMYSNISSDSDDIEYPALIV